MTTANRLSNPAKIVSWVLQIVAAYLMIQTLYFKFTGQPESIYIFSELGAEPWGRWGSGVIELIASAMLFFRKWIWVGATLGLGTMVGAIMAHLTVIGINVNITGKEGEGDGGLLFTYALIVFASCAIILLLRRREINPMGLLKK